MLVKLACPVEFSQSLLGPTHIGEHFAPPDVGEGVTRIEFDGAPKLTLGPRLVPLINRLTKAKHSVSFR